MRNIFFLRKGIDDTKEAYHIIFEAAISTSDLEKCDATIHMELNKSYANVDYKYVTKRFQEMFIIMFDIGLIHQRIPSRWHKDNIQAMRGVSILF